ncbi:hypothetical protein QBC39DRAFT_363082 [Podospora conica]|nr:hypothetical protein QBC39DRAFT_363082 [Schizothecium conicum]
MVAEVVGTAGVMVREKVVVGGRTVVEVRAGMTVVEVVAILLGFMLFPMVFGWFEGCCVRDGKSEEVCLGRYQKKRRERNVVPVVNIVPKRAHILSETCLPTGRDGLDEAQLQKSPHHSNDRAKLPAPPFVRGLKEHDLRGHGGDLRQYAVCRWIGAWRKTNPTVSGLGAVFAPLSRPVACAGIRRLHRCCGDAVGFLRGF